MAQHYYLSVRKRRLDGLNCGDAGGCVYAYGSMKTLLTDAPLGEAISVSGTPPGWAARIDVALTQGTGRTRVARCRQQGPLYLQRAFYPEHDGTCHLYLLHPPGGTVQGDSLHVHLTSMPGVRALVTTPAAAKVYRTPLQGSEQVSRVDVADGACVEWLPQEAIVFNGARASNTLRFDLAEHARLIAWDITCLGRPAAGEAFDDGLFESAIELRIGGELQWIERTSIPGAATSAFMRSRWGLGGCQVTGTLLAYGPGDWPCDVLEVLREHVDQPGRAGVTDIDGVVVCRVLGHNTYEVRDTLCAAWQVLRRALLDKAPVVPRIWST